LHDENFPFEHPNPVSYLQDEVQLADPAASDIPTDAEYGDMNQPANQPEHLNSEFMVNKEGNTAVAKVVKRARDNKGNPIGKRHANPLLDTREYECELQDGSFM
jgi:hypothetical protein